MSLLVRIVRPPKRARRAKKKDWPFMTNGTRIWEDGEHIGPYEVRGWVDGLVVLRWWSRRRQCWNYRLKGRWWWEYGVESGRLYCRKKRHPGR